MMRGGAAGTINGCGGSTAATRTGLVAHAEVSAARAASAATIRLRRSARGKVNVVSIVSRHLRPSTVGLEVACGNRMRIVVPVPGVDCTSISPSCSWMVRNTIDSPMPLPPDLVVK